MQEASPGYRFDPNRLLQTSWTSTQTSRLLLEAGYTVAISQWNQFFMPGVTPDMMRVTDQGLGINYGSGSVYRGDPNNTDRYSARGSVSYVTGSHNFKAGFLHEHLTRDNFFFRPMNTAYRFRNGVPNRITQYATPSLEKNRVNEIGIYAQDQWTIDRLTLNLGVRFDSMERLRTGPGVPGGAQSGDLAGRDVRQRLAPAGELRAAEQRAGVAGIQPARRGRLRPVRGRANGAQGRPGPLRREVEHQT